MSWQEAESALVDMFPPHRYTITMRRSCHIGKSSLSLVGASVYVGRPELDRSNDPICSADAYDEHDDMDQGGWATVVNNIRSQVEDKL